MPYIKDEKLKNWHGQHGSRGGLLQKTSVFDKKNVKGDILCIKGKLTFKHNAYRSKHTTEKNIVQLLNSFFIGLLKKSYFNSV